MVTLYGGIEFNEDAQQRPLLPINERVPNHETMARMQADKIAHNTRVAIPARVVAWDASKQTITAQPLIREKVLDRATGSLSFIDLPQLPDVPVCFPQAGNFVLTMPIAVGDEVMILFADMCIDSWWARGDVQNWNDRRRHDLSDGIAVVGINSVPNVINNIASDGSELRTKDGNVAIKIENEQATVTVNETVLTITDGTVTIDATTINLNGTLNINGSAYLAHKHAGVMVGPSLTGGVTP